MWFSVHQTPAKAILPVLLLWSGAAATQVEAPTLFASHQIVEMTLTGPFGTLFADKEARVERPFTLRAQGMTHDIEVRLRGHSRVRVCDFPPLRLNFSIEATANTIFAGQDKLKLVTHCVDKKRPDLDVVDEYIAYRILNVIQAASYRVRLLRISYIDTGSNAERNSSARFAFALESAASLAARLGAEPANATGVSHSKYDEAQAAHVYVFQYMIANTDWSLVTSDNHDFCCHNIDLYERDGKLILVPYDFDLAGIVNARYAYPDRTLPIDRVTQRIYRGVCMDDKKLRRAVRNIVAKRADILKVVADVPGLSERQRKRRSRFLEGFFEKAEKEDKLLKNFASRCIEKTKRHAT